MEQDKCELGHEVHHFVLSGGIEVSGQILLLEKHLQQQVLCAGTYTTHHGGLSVL